jgi:DNA-binding transcriptional ArsR family regulator
VVSSSDVYAALASPVRRSLLTMLAERPHTVNELAKQFDMRRPSVSEHLRILRESGLVHARQTGRQRIYGINAEPLRDVAEWLAPFERFWRERASALADLLDDGNDA